MESSNNKNQEISKNNDISKNNEQKISNNKPDLEQVMKESTAENRPPPPAKPITQQPQLPVVANLTKSIVTKSSSGGSPWKTTAVEQNSAQVRKHSAENQQFFYYLSDFP